MDAENICTIIESSSLLIDLDISWNELPVWSMLKICETLSRNRQLQHLNLSWNYLTKRASGKFEHDSAEIAKRIMNVRNKLLANKKIESRDFSHFHYNAEIEQRIYEYLIN